MCGIAGFFHPTENREDQRIRWRAVLNQMNRVQKRRGPDDEGIFLEKGTGLGHVRLSIIDLVSGHQPMVRISEAGSCALVLNGEIYNMTELKRELQKDGAVFETSSDTEVLLLGLMRQGPSFVKKLNGIFAAAFWDGREERLWLFRDRLGVKPLFYTFCEGALVFSSEIKGLLAYPGVEPEVDARGLCEIFGLGPAKTCGQGVFRGILEILPGHMACQDRDGFRESPYWKLKAKPHLDSFPETVEKTAWLVEDAVRLQLLSDVPVGTFLSGGIDSSLVTAISARILKKRGKTLNTFSFDFQDNQKYFRSNSFQPDQDGPWARKTADFLHTTHRCLECTNQDQLEGLYKAVDARDLPCMADVESSMLYFCSKVAPINRVVLTGECADEIFGGYPWFHRKDLLNARGFPWSLDFSPRKALLSDEVLRELPLEAYAMEACENTLRQTPRLPGEEPVRARQREIAWLNLRWFMLTLLDRMDRTSMYSGLEARVPLADHRIVEYVFNVPWEMKCPDGIVKGLLRHAGEGFLPTEILWRKKSPYPKTYDPAYEMLLGDALKEVLASPQAPIRQFLDTKKVQRFLDTPSDYGRPWYGQLMAGPQLLAYMLQVNYWLEAYDIRVL